MYHSVIGKRLVTYINERDGTAYTVRDFFDTVYIPLFFGNARLLQNVNNSPFDQAITKQKKPFTLQLQAECLKQVHNKVQGQLPDASFFLGGPASGSTETTSGQVTSMGIPITEEDIYASWIGAALGLTVQGGMILLIDAKDILLTTYDGWREYRKYLDQTPKLKPLQVNAWNGQWVTSRMRNKFWQPTLDRDDAALETQKWVELLFALSYHYREGPIRRLLAYVYSLGQSNKTLGFVQLNLLEVRRLAQFYRQIFDLDGLLEADFASLYETDEAFRFACGRTEIGLRALRPKDVFKAELGIPAPPKATDGKKQMAFNTYQTWIMAMLKNQELMTRAKELATVLDRFRKNDDRGKTDRKQKVEELLKSRTFSDFLEGATKLLNIDSSDGEIFRQIGDDLASLPSANVPLFLTLLRFQYALAKTDKKGEISE